MRTPVQREQNFAVEGMINEVAAAVGVDPIEYRMRHTADQRLIDVFTKLKAVHGWETRPSPNPAKAKGLDRYRPRHGRHDPLERPLGRRGGRDRRPQDRQGHASTATPSSSTPASSSTRSS